LKSCLVTGTTGFVGSALCSALKSSNYNVRLSNQRLNEMDWSHSLVGIEIIVHLAARVHILRDSAVDPLAEFRAVNVVGTLNLARQAAAAGVKRFVFLSSVKVNGEFTLPNKPFSAAHANPQDPYGVSKHEAEIGLRKIAAATGMAVVIIRPPLIYGAGVKANFLSLICVVKRGVPLPFGSVTQNCRSFVALDNLIDLIITCIHHPNAANQTFLVSDNEDVSTADLLRRMATAQGVPSRLFPVPLIVLNSAAKLIGKQAVAQRLLGNLQVDISHTMNTLNWQPPISLDEGLRRAATDNIT
jgi:nucleoside-diphosphate-sugar epimerase